MIGNLIKFGWSLSLDSIEFWMQQYERWKQLTCKHEYCPVVFYNDGEPTDAVICLNCGTDRPA
jgi:hypothetical protein